MNIYDKPPQEDYLAHYGVKGMKWGVRRYQNYDGSYTQKGLERYRKAESDYEGAKQTARSTKSAYKAGTATKRQYQDAKRAVKAEKRKMESAYGKLKMDKRADEGKKLYRRGKTISSNTKMLAISESAVLVGSRVVGNILGAATGNPSLSYMSERAIRAGGTAVNAILYAKNQSEAKKLRAYYAH